jgi:DNA-binding protein H-NS
MAAPKNLSRLSVDELIALRDQLDDMLQKKAGEERRRLESQLAALSIVNGGGRKRNGSSSVRGSTVAPKYRNPENPSETWAGRGLKPKWLAAALKSGSKSEDFSIAARAKTAAVRRTSRGKGRKVKK